MSKFRLTSVFSVAALSLGLALSLSATTVSVGGSAPAGYTPVTFGPALPAGWTSTGTAGTANVSVPLQYTQPTGSTGYFAYAEAGSSITAPFSAGITSLDLLWGSPDVQNTITFSGPSGTVSYTPGAGLLSGLTPSQTGAQYVLFTATPGVDWTSVTFSSGINAFEFASVSTLAAPSPEPASIALLAGGLLAIGAGAIRRRSSK